MIPCLRRFYGGAAKEWLDMPGWLFDLHAEEMPKLQACEALQGATVAAVGAGNMKKHDLTAIRKAWLREAGLNPKAEKPRSLDDLKARLEGVGIGYKEA